MYSSKNKKLIRGGAYLTLGTTLGTIAVFVRNIIITRLISVEDFGIAATFGMIMAMIEMSNDVAIDRYLIQSRKGNTPRLQSSLQWLQVARGCLNSAILFALAIPLSQFFNVEEAAWAYQIIAIIPLINGFTHLDPKRAQRHYIFSLSTFNDFAPKIATVILIWPLSYITNDYTIMLWLIISQTAFSTILSHVFASRPYRLTFDKGIIYSVLLFGWPLLLNGILIFFTYQGDRMLVARFFSIESLAWYSTAFTITMVPAATVSKVLRTLIMPILANTKEKLDELNHNFQFSFALCLFIGLFSAICYVVAGPSLYLLVYGVEYTKGIEVVVWLGLMQSVRILRIAPNTASISLAKTKIPLYSNVMRTLAIPMGLVTIALDYPIAAISICTLAAELFAFYYSMFLISRQTDVHVRKCCLFSFLLIPVIIYYAYQGQDDLTTPSAMGAAIDLSVAIPIALIYSTFAIGPYWKQLIKKSGIFRK